MKKEKREAQFEKSLKILSKHFDQLYINDPEFAKQLPPNSYILFQVEVDGDVTRELFESVQDFNSWVWKVCQPQIQEDRNLVVIRFLFEAETKKQSSTNPLARMLKNKHAEVELQKVYA